MAERSHPVTPGSVYVWRGFKSSSLSYDQFAAFLGTVFVPACALLQPRVGLRAYLPSMVPQAGKPAVVPDQTALMFWNDPKAHDEAKKAIAVRIYSNLHGDVYDMARSGTQEVPKPLDPSTVALAAEQPYYLLDQPADWMLGAVHHLVGARRPDLAPADFLSQAASGAKSLQQKPPSGVDGILVCCGTDYLAPWVHVKGQSSGLGSALDGLAQLTRTVLPRDAQPLRPETGLWDAWPGLDLLKTPCLNFQFDRPAAARPRALGKS